MHKHNSSYEVEGAQVMNALLLPSSLSPRSPLQTLPSLLFFLLFSSPLLSPSSLSSCLFVPLSAESIIVDVAVGGAVDWSAAISRQKSKSEE